MIDTAALDAKFGAGNWHMDEYSIYYHPPKEKGYPEGLAGFVFLREDKKDEYIAIQAEKDKAVLQADMAAAKREANQPIKVTNAQISKLAEKYDPRNMTQEEYTDFLYEMIDLGVITKEDACFIRDFTGGGGALPFAYAASSRNIHWNEAPYTTEIYNVPLDYPQSDGDILTMYGFQAAFRTKDPDTGTVYRGRIERTYGKVYQVLQRMDQVLPYSEQRAQASAQKMQESNQKSYQTSRLMFDLRNSRIAAPVTAARR
ncbi:MAG: hypothetical protein K2O18_06735 [Oscillospiraceae bacterium]|nr:hypothetical protein [Oscillospiraceae bacterium]